MNNESKAALVVGSTGITGLNLTTRLASRGWQVYGLARKPKSMAGVTPVVADLQDAAALKAALADVNPAHVFICTWLRQDNPRLPGLNFYYTQEDLLFEAAAKGGFGWTVHRSHSIRLARRRNPLQVLLCSAERKYPEAIRRLQSYQSGWGYRPDELVTPWQAKLLARPKWT